MEHLNVVQHHLVDFIVFTCVGRAGVFLRDLNVEDVLKLILKSGFQRRIHFCSQNYPENCSDGISIFIPIWVRGKSPAALNSVGWCFSLIFWKRQVSSKMSFAFCFCAVKMVVSCCQDTEVVLFYLNLSKSTWANLKKKAGPKMADSEMRPSYSFVLFLFLSFWQSAYFQSKGIWRNGGDSLHWMELRGLVATYWVPCVWFGKRKNQSLTNKVFSWFEATIFISYLFHYPKQLFQFQSFPWCFFARQALSENRQHWGNTHRAHNTTLYCGLRSIL